MADSGRNLIAPRCAIVSRRSIASRCLLASRRWLAVLLLPLLLLSCALQTARGQGRETTETAQMQPPSFRVFALGPVNAVFYDTDKGQQRRVSFSSSAYSRPYPLPANGELNFYRLKESADGLPPERVEVAQIQVGVRSGEQPVVIVLLPNPDYVEGAEQAGRPVLEFAALVLDDSLAAHPLDTIRVVNFAPRQVAVQVGEAQAVLSPQRREAVIPYPQGDRAIVQVAAVLQGVWAPITSTQQMFAPQTRLTLFAVDDRNESGRPEGESVTVYKVVELF